MPLNYAHYRFGTAILSTMPADIRRSIQRFRRLYDVGLHGPDLFYFYSPSGSKGKNSLSVKYHELSGKVFFTRICRAIRLERSEAAEAYLYGVLCHYVLDSTLHPFIALTAAESGASEQEIEAELDRYLLEQDGKLPADGNRLSKHLRLTDGECETVASFYPPSTGKTVRRALQSTVLATRMMASREGAGRKMLETGLGIVDKRMQAMLIGTKPNPKCCHLNEPLMQLYEEAVAKFPECLQQLQAHMTYSAPLEAEFEKTFG